MNAYIQRKEINNMNNETFCDTLWDIAEEYNTVYMKGVFGSPVTEGLISAKAKQYPKWYTSEKQKFLRTLFDILL